MACSDLIVRDSEILGGKGAAAGPLFYEPSVITGVTTAMTIAHDEIFGPVASLIRFETEEEVVRLANDTPFGLAAYLFSRDIGRAWRVAEQLDAGMVGVNEGIFSNETVPFGGVKESGLGREGGVEATERGLDFRTPST